MSKNGNGERFGDRLARLRKAAGYSQRDLAAETGISQRMIAYYEKQTEHPPTHVFPVLAKALGVSADELFGIKETKKVDRARDNRLWRRFSQVEKLPSPERKQIVQILDAFLDREKLRRSS
jgi:transcriptional regulator with XRE-family HTH domain